MSIALEFWNQKRPIYERLPKLNGGYDNDLSDWLTGFWDQHTCDTKDRVTEITTKQLNPLTCDDNWLDFLAQLLGWDKTHWQKKWSVDSKRLLLSRSLDFIWERKGNLAVINYVLKSLRLKAIVLEVGNFIIGTDLVGEPIGSNPWVVKIIMPTFYQFDSLLKEVEYILDRFLPCWLQRIYVYTDIPFSDIELLVVDANGNVLEDNTSKAVDLNN